MGVRWLLVKSHLKVLALTLLMVAVVWSEEPTSSQAAVLDPATGKVLGHYLLTRRMDEYIQAGTEDTHFEYLKTFCFDYKPDPAKLVDEQGRQYTRPDRLFPKVFLGILPDGRRLMWFAKDGKSDLGSLKVVKPDGTQRVLLKDRNFGGAGATALFTPGVCVAHPYLLSQDQNGVECRSISDGRLLWKSSWNFGHCRWNRGAWCCGGALYADTKEGLSRVNLHSGKIEWTWPDSVELRDVKVYPDGLLYVKFQNGPKDTILNSLRKQAVSHYKSPGETDFWVGAIPYKAGYFGTTWQGQNYLNDGKVAVWERIDGQWRFIFDYQCTGQSDAELDKLYAEHQLSSRMRQLLTNDTGAIIYHDTGNTITSP